MQPQAADGSEQDDFFLASDEDDPGAAAVGSSAVDMSDAAAFERAAAGSKQPTGLQGAAGIGSHSYAACLTPHHQLNIQMYVCE
jgi:hypothetical protein